MVEGIQAQGVGACPKHFAANNQEYRRMSVSAQADEQTLREIYLAAFERIVRQAAPRTLMCAYNRINGTYCSETPGCWIRCCAGNGLRRHCNDRLGRDG